ncbi:MAG: hypothetical protein V3W43_08065, partial [Desulfatiglandaceae bacterium]
RSKGVPETRRGGHGVFTIKLDPYFLNRYSTKHLVFLIYLIFINLVIVNCIRWITVEMERKKAPQTAYPSRSEASWEDIFGNAVRRVGVKSAVDCFALK